MKNLLILYILITVIGCSKDKNVDGKIISLCVSDYSPKVIVVRDYDSIYSIEEINLIDSSSRVIFTSYSFIPTNLQYYKSDSNLIFIENNSSICSYSIPEKRKEYLVKDKSQIFESVTLDSEDAIIFTMAANNSENSPLIDGSNKGFELYKLHIHSKKITKLTNLNSYRISYLESKNDTLIFAHIISKGLKGLGIFNIKNTSFDKVSIPSSIEPSNNQWFTHPVWNSIKEELYFLSYNRIYSFNPKSKNCSKISSNEAPGIIRNMDYSKFCNMIVYSKDDKKDIQILKIN